MPIKHLHSISQSWPSKQVENLAAVLKRFSEHLTVGDIKSFALQWFVETGQKMFGCHVVDNLEFRFHQILHASEEAPERHQTLCPSGSKLRYGRKLPSPRRLPAWQVALQQSDGGSQWFTLRSGIEKNQSEHHPIPSWPTLLGCPRNFVNG